MTQLLPRLLASFLHFRMLDISMQKIGTYMEWLGHKKSIRAPHNNGLFSDSKILNITESNHLSKECRNVLLKREEHKYVIFS